MATTGITPRQMKEIKSSLATRAVPLELRESVDDWLVINECERLTFKSATDLLDYLDYLPVERTPDMAHLPSEVTKVLVNSCKGKCYLCGSQVPAGQGLRAFVDGGWQFYHSVDECSAVDSETLPEIVYPSSLRQDLDRFVANLDRLEPPIAPDNSLFELSSARDFDLPFDLELPLLGYQKAAVEYVRRTRKTLVCQDMGLGKTPIGISVAHMAVQEGRKVLVVVPPNLRYQWMSEFKKFAPWLKVASVSGRSPKALPKSDVLVVGDSVVDAWQLKIAGRYDSLIVDEAHRMKNQKSRRTKAVQYIASRMSPDAFSVMLSGTIIPNRPAEFISPLTIIGRLDTVFGSRRQFINRYCDYKIVNGFPNMNGASNVTELNNILRSTCYTRTRKIDVLEDLPPKRRAQLDVELPEDVMARYRRAEEDFLSFVYENYGNDAFLAASKAPVITEMNKLRQLLGEAKVDSAIAQIESLLEAGEQVIAFAYHTSILKQLREHFEEIGVVAVQGGMTAEAKDRAVQKFTSGEARLFLGQYEAASVGLNLQVASHVVMVEIPWSPATGSQAEDRAWRYGNKNPVVAWWLTAIDPKKPTIDSRMWSLINAKAETISACLDGWGEDMNAEAGSVTALLLKDMIGF